VINSTEVLEFKAATKGIPTAVFHGLGDTCLLNPGMW